MQIVFLFCILESITLLPFQIIPFLLLSFLFSSLKLLLIESVLYLIFLPTLNVLTKLENTKKQIGISRVLLYLIIQDLSIFRIWFLETFWCMQNRFSSIEDNLLSYCFDCFSTIYQTSCYLMWKLKN